MRIIHHGTPLTPRAALLDVCRGRAMCVSFYRPEDAEAVEAISPAIMFRQRRVFVLEAGAAVWQGMGAGSRLVTVLSMAGTAALSAGALGSHPRHARGTVSAQRHVAAGMAVRSEGRAALAHGWPDRAPAATVRSIRPGLPWLDRSRKGHRLRGLSSPHGRGRACLGQPLARPAHDARDRRGLRLSVRLCRQHIARTKWMAL